MSESRYIQLTGGAPKCAGQVGNSPKGQLFARAMKEKRMCTPVPLNCYIGQTCPRKRACYVLTPHGFFYSCLLYTSDAADE